MSGSIMINSEVITLDQLTKNMTELEQKTILNTNISWKIYIIVKSIKRKVTKQSKLLIKM